MPEVTRAFAPLSWRLGILALLLAVTFTARFSVASAAPAISLSPTSGPVGTLVQATGSGFTPNVPVRACWVGPGQTCQVQLFQGNTNATGGFAFSFLVPNDTPGLHAVDATELESGLKGGGAFTITTSATSTATALATASPTGNPALVTPCLEYGIAFIGGPGEATLAPGSSTTRVIRVLAVSPPDARTTFSVDGLPPGVTVSFNPPVLIGSGDVVVTITVRGDVAFGPYRITIHTSCNGSLFKDFGFSLQVGNVPPSTTPTPTISPTPSRTPSPTATPNESDTPTPTPTTGTPGVTPTPTRTPIITTPPECPVGSEEGWFEPAQGVWQDDYAFADQFTKQLDRPLHSTVISAELNMVKGRHTLLFGIRPPDWSPPRAGGVPPYEPAILGAGGMDAARRFAADDHEWRDKIVVQGTTTGSNPVNVKFRFVHRETNNIIYQEPAYRHAMLLDGTCTTPRPFRLELDASNGIPPVGSAYPPYIFPDSGAYTIDLQLIREDTETPIQPVIVDGRVTYFTVSVHGVVTETIGPRVRFLPLSLLNLPINDPTAPLAGTADEIAAQYEVEMLQLAADVVILAADFERFVPDFYPLAPGAIRTSSGDTLDFTGVEVLDATGAPQPVFMLELPQRLAAIGRRATTAAHLAGYDRVVLLERTREYDSFIAPGSAAITPGKKFIIVRDSTPEATTVAHELIHTTGKDYVPFELGAGPAPLNSWLWSSGEMLDECFLAYHNEEDHGYAWGHRIVRGGVESRERIFFNRSLMGSAGGTDAQWIDQCSYWHLLKVLRNRIDPPLILVQGLLTQSGGQYGGRLEPAYQLDGEVDLEDGQGGEWAIVLRDASGAPLGRYPFSPVWTLPTHVGDIELDTVSFAYRVPDLPGVAEISLESPGGIVDRKIYSANAPVVTVTTPADGSTVVTDGGTIRMEWNGTDADGDALLYTVLYSDDDGENWADVAFETPSTAADIRLNLSAAAHMVRVIATDGARSAEAVSRFTLGSGQ